MLIIQGAWFDVYPMNCSSEEITATAIKISMHGIQIEITNAAAESTIVQTLTALQKLC